MFLFVSTVSTISDLYTVKQLKTQMSAKPEYTTSMGFTGFMFAVVTTLDINAGDFKRIVGSKCGLCKARMLPDSNQCQNSQCSSFGTTVPMEYFFDFRIALADHTDSISAVRLSDQPAENFLQCTAQQFLAMSDRDKVYLRAKILLERVKVYFKANYNSATGSTQRVKIISIAPADIEEMAKLM
jgi:hypothetical protein